jgi:DNA-binding transcriptional LysR family regulator
MNFSRVSLETDLLRTFLTVARHGNVTRGALAMHRTQSAVSIQIKRLEENLAVQLFRREPRGVALTEAGERLRVAAQRIVEDLDHTVRTFREDPIGGLVRVGIPDEYGSDVLPTVLADFAVHYPAIEIYVQCAFSVGFPAAIKRGELDLAVFASLDGPKQLGSLTHDPTVWVASRQHQRRDGEPIALALFDRACWWRDMATTALDALDQPYRIAFSSESVAGIKAAITSGLGVGVLARSTVESSMVILDERHGFPSLPDSVLRLQCGATKSAAIHAMAEAIERGFGQLKRGV